MKTGFIFLAKECYFLVLFLMLVPVSGIGPVMEKELADGSSSASLTAVWLQGLSLNKYGRRYVLSPQNSWGGHWGELGCWDCGLSQWGGRQQKLSSLQCLVTENGPSESRIYWKLNAPGLTVAKWLLHYIHLQRAERDILLLATWHFRWSVPLSARANHGFGSRGHHQLENTVASASPRKHWLFLTEIY